MKNSICSICKIDYQKTIIALKNNLYKQKDKWKKERSNTMKYIGRCYFKLKDYKEAKYWYYKSLKEYENIDTYIELSLLYNSINDYVNCEKTCLKALELNNKKDNKIIYNLLSICNYHKKQYNYSLLFINMALDIDKNNKTLINNKELIKKELV